MAKEMILTPVKKGKAEFNLIGEAKVSDFTFKLDIESKKANSDWIYNQGNLGVNCGDNGTIYADLMGGYGSSRENVIMVHGKKKNDNGQEVDDFNNRFNIDWDDRLDLDEEALKNIGDRCFITVGVEKDDKGNTVYKKFLTEYDAIAYLEDTLKDGSVVNVKGNLKYQKYNDMLQVKKQITSVALSKAEPKDYKATFTQTLLLSEGAIGKPDKETMLVPIDAFIVDFTKEHNDSKIVRMVDGKRKEGCNLPMMRTFFVKITEDKDKLTKFLKLFKAKSKKVIQMTVDGYFTKGEIKTEEVSDKDIPDDIKELIELGYIDKEEILGTLAFVNGGGKKPEQMIIQSPHIKFVGEDKLKMPVVDRDDSIYTENDIDPLLIIKQLGAVTEILPEEEEVGTEVDMDKMIDQATKPDDEDSDDDDESWINDL